MMVLLDLQLSGPIRIKESDFTEKSRQASRTVGN